MEPERERAERVPKAKPKAKAPKAVGRDPKAKPKNAVGPKAHEAHAKDAKDAKAGGPKTKAGGPKPKANLADLPAKGKAGGPKAGEEVLVPKMLEGKIGGPKAELEVPWSLLYSSPSPKRSISSPSSAPTMPPLSPPPLCGPPPAKRMRLP